LDEGQDNFIYFINILITAEKHLLAHNIKV